MKRAPAYLAVLFAGGIIFADQAKIPFKIIYPAAMSLLIISVLSFHKNFNFTLSLSLLVFSLGAAALSNSRILPADHIVNQKLLSKEGPYLLKGVIVSHPQEGKGISTFSFRVKGIEFSDHVRSASGDILVRVSGKEEFSCGDRLVLGGKLYWPHAPYNRDRHGYGDYLLNRGIYFIMRANSVTLCSGTKTGSPFAISMAAWRIKKKMKEAVFKYMPDLPAAILNAMVLGDKKDIPPGIIKTMIKSGTVHILVVSGFNVGIVAFIIIVLLKIMRVAKRPRLVIASLLLIFYCLMTGASTPVARSTVMAIVFIIAHLLKREPDIYNSLGVAALFVLGINPRQAFDVGFQLSFSSVISIVCFYPKLKGFFKADSSRLKIIRWALSGFCLSLSAWLGTAGFIAYYFGIISPVTIFANILIAPLASLITLSGFCLIFAAFLFPGLAPLFARAAELAVAALISLNSLFTKLPFSCIDL